VFNIGMIELILILLVAFLVVGPKDLPKVARWIARQIKNLRKFIRDIKNETGWNDFEAEFKSTGDEIRETIKTADISNELKNEVHGIEEEVKSVQADLNQAVSDVKSEIK